MRRVAKLLPLAQICLIAPTFTAKQNAPSGPRLARMRRSAPHEATSNCLKAERSEYDAYH